MNCPAPSLRPHYRALTATTGRSAPVPRIGTLALAVSAACGSPSRGQKPRPSLSGRQVLLFHASACDELTPPIHRAPPGPHTGSSPTEDPPQRAFVPGPPTDPSFDAIVVSFRCVSSGSHMFVFSSHTRPANSETSPATLTTPALDRRSLRWFGISTCTATPEDPPPSLAQHGSCRRSSTSSSSLPFRTHVGAGNSAVVVDLPRCGPMLVLVYRISYRFLVPRIERETPGQRPRPNYGHPQAAGLLWPTSSSGRNVRRRRFDRGGGASVAGGQPSHWDLPLIGDFASARYDFTIGIICCGRSPCVRGRICLGGQAPRAPKQQSPPPMGSLRLLRLRWQEPCRCLQHGWRSSSTVHRGQG